MENRESIAELGIRDVSNKLEVECPTETRCEEPGKEHGKEIDFVKSAGYSKRRKRRTKKQKSGHSFVLDIEEEESRGVEESSDRRTTTPENLLMMAINLESVRGEQRKGYDKDDAKLKRICKRLGDNCKLIKFNEVKSETMKEFYWKLRESSEGCSIISIFVLSHGNYNSFCLSDGTSLNISTFIDRVTSVVKPKKLWCAFVFCRIYKEYGSISEPNYENAVISYSTSPGCRSCRLGEEGSIYMTSLEKSISKYGITKVMFNRVKHFTKVQARRHGELQVPCHKWNLQDDTFFVLPKKNKSKKKKNLRRARQALSSKKTIKKTKEGVKPARTENDEEDSKEEVLQSPPTTTSNISIH